MYTLSVIHLWFNLTLNKDGMMIGWYDAV